VSERPLIRFETLRLGGLRALAEGLVGIVFVAPIHIAGTTVLLGSGGGALDWRFFLGQLFGALVFGLVAVPVTLVELRSTERPASGESALFHGLLAWAVAIAAALFLRVGFAYLSGMLTGRSPTAGVQGVMDIASWDASVLMTSLFYLFTGTLPYGVAVALRQRASSLVLQVMALGVVGAAVGLLTPLVWILGSWETSEVVIYLLTSTLGGACGGALTIALGWWVADRLAVAVWGPGSDVGLPEDGWSS
jgi:hypothetical protein